MVVDCRCVFDCWYSAGSWWCRGWWSGVSVDWIGLRLSISDLVRRFGPLRGRCTGGCSSCVYGIVGILRFCGSIVAGRRVAVGSVTDWIGFRVSFSDSVRGSVSMGD